ncbi:hypothetical protein SOASR030_06560 [Leminorella grimontii]|uniref:Metal-dependent phosphohydrolase n=1 Tax=Leminorella grimontii TaxID=82981 RepID=A0AAV5N068_9GAMM|nr:HD domain-containing protein [Leminorella grimontii]KFC96266.1 MptB, dihydroneopterin 2, 3 -cyclic phosphate phosphodiesterase [Leminorella grimontii ATCC 33999 = DSM 5078]GKX54544.1 hypothetical protein SOASR030_06560 [Leminorella grimontii]VFS58964.1 Predicted HD-superfamily hydrolase [Leminorella grimontii]
MKSDYNRRLFIKSATVATAAMLFSQAPAWAQGTSRRITQAINPISLNACKALSPEEMATGSSLVQHARSYLEQQIGTVKNGDLRRTIATIYSQPQPLSVIRLDADSRREVWQTLSAKGYTKADEKSFLPPMPTKRKDGEAFFSAPGSGYQSHHAYPGGLATHVAANVFITNGIVDTYVDVYNYQVERDIALSAQLLHDLHKPYVFQWQEDRSSRQEQALAGTGEHHILSVAELIYRKMPAELVVATACAHQAPTAENDEAQIAAWLDAAAIIAGTDPVSYGLVVRKGDGVTLANIARQEGYICHLGDHDFVLSVPAVKQTLPVIEKIAKQDYQIAPNDAAAFNALRNRLYSTYSAMRVHYAYATQGEEAIRALMHGVVMPA